MTGTGSSMGYSLLLFTVILSLQEVYRTKLASSELFTILGGFTSSLIFLVLLTFIGNFQESCGMKTGWGAGSCFLMARLLDEIESKLTETAYVAGNEFSMADVAFIPVLARLSLLYLEDEYIRSRASLFEYWGMVRERPSYKKVIGRYFDGWRKYRTLSKTWWSLRIRSLFNKY